MLPLNTILQGRYRILQQLGRGGMGAVYQAVDENLSCLVAVKETFAIKDEHRRAFEREAKLLANLTHPALPRVTDHFTQAEGQFLVMQFIPGHDLAELLALRERPFPTPKVLEWADHLLDALEELHAYQPPIIHRDIKPSNLKLTPKGKIILLDFGLAKGAAGQMSTVDPDSYSQSIYGYTRHYAPLEQMRGAGTDQRSDIYSLGATFWTLLTAETPPDALARVGDKEDGNPDPLRPANEINGEVSPFIAALLHQALSLNRNGRFTSATEMREALREAARQAQADAAAERERQLAAEAARLAAEEEQRRRDEAEQQRREAEERERIEAEKRQRSETLRQAYEAARRLEKQERQQREAEAARRLEEEAARLREAEAARLRAEEAERIKREAEAATERAAKAFEQETETKPAQRADVAVPTLPASPPRVPPPDASTETSAADKYLNTLLRSLPTDAATATAATGKQSQKAGALAKGGGSKRFMLMAIAAVLVVVGVAALVWWQTPTPPPGMVYVPGGEFTMGRNDGDEYERPAHRVTVKPFFIDKYEVTNEDYARFIKETDNLKQTWEKKTPLSGTEHNPVTGVTWDDARAYANWAGKRLPTEEEWEFAARGKDGRRYPWGNNWRAGLANADSFFGSLGPFFAKANVGLYKGTSPFGAFDMVGNAWEWTDSKLIPYPGGSLPVKVSDDMRVIRGGSYLSNPNQATTTYRRGWRASGEESYSSTGFRCVKDIEK